MTMLNKIDVLDHGFVRLVSYTQPYVHEEIAQGKLVVDCIPTEWSGDLEIVRNARVSFDADWRTGADEGKDKKLIEYMLDNDHTSPFEALVFTFEVKAPIFVFRQWHRHRTWSYNEVSARYAELPEEFYVPKPEHIGTQSKDNKQARDLDWRTPASAPVTVEWIKKHNQLAFEIYRNLLESGVPRELARTVLPLATYSRMFATVNLHNLFRFLRQRLHSHAQYEIRMYAQALLRLAHKVAPIAVEHFNSTLTFDLMNDKN